jgi:peptide/nickel transport system substrate-binding protein
MKNISLDIIEQLSEINLSVDLNVLTVYEWMNKISSKNTSFYLIGWVPSGVDGGEIFDYMLRSVDPEKNIGSFNPGYYSNHAVDIIGEKVSWTMDSTVRQKLIQEGFAIAMEDIACIPLFSIQWIYGFSDDIHFIPRPDLNIRLEEIRFIS